MSLLEHVLTPLFSEIKLNSKLKYNPQSELCKGEVHSFEEETLLDIMNEWKSFCFRARTKANDQTQDDERALR